MSSHGKHLFGLMLSIAAAVAMADGSIKYVNTNLTEGADNGSSWPNAYRTTQSGRTPLQRALDAAAAGDEVWVAEGTYKPASGTDRNESFHVKAVKMYGGFAGGETSPGRRNPACHETILSGDLGGDDEPDFVNRSDNSCHVVWVDNGAVSAETRLDGFTIRGGYETCHDEIISIPPTSGGGGIVLDHSGAWIANCRIQDNYAENFGGGILIGMESSDGPGTTMVRCAVSNNRAAVSGGGLHQEFCGAIRIYNSVFTENEHQSSGGAIQLAGDGTKVIANCLIARNAPTAQSSGGASGVFIGEAFARIIHSTIADNGTSGEGDGNGLYVYKATVEVDNSIIWGNLGRSAANAGRQIKVATPTNPAGTVRVRWSDVQRLEPDRTVDVSPESRVFFDEEGNGYCPSPNLWANLGCVSADDPYFVNPNPPLFDYSVTHTATTESRSIDAGSNVLVAEDEPDLDDDSNTSEPTPFDIVEAPRFADDPVRDDCEQAPTGVDCGDSPIVDMGAYELPACEDDEDCDDRVWCTLDSCGDISCEHECFERNYGDVYLFPYDAPYVGRIDIDDILTVLDCFGNTCTNCGRYGEGTMSGCDLAGATGCPCTPDGAVDVTDINTAIDAFGSNPPCEDCDCGGDSLMGGGGSAASGLVDAAEQVIAYLTSKEVVDSHEAYLLTTLAEVLTTWCQTRLASAEKVLVVKFLEDSLSSVQNDVAAEMFPAMIETLSE